MTVTGKSLERIVAEQEAEALRILPHLLYNPVREQGVTCIVCCEPINPGVELCRQCSSAVHDWPTLLADRVVPLTYASDTETPQIRRDLAQYKNSPTASGRAAAAPPLTYLIWYFTHRHRFCLDRESSLQVSALIAVPSGHTVGRPDGNPLLQLARYLPPSWERVAAERISDAAARIIDPETVELSSDVDLSGRHVVVFDDTWTTGASAQGVSVAAKRAGAAQVSIIVIGRWANDGWRPSREFFHQRPHTAWTGDVCPVTGGVCPSV